MRKWTIFIWIFICGFVVAGAAQPALTLTLSDNTIGSRDPVQVTYEFKNISRPSLPDLDFQDWTVHGPQLSQSTTVINGNATSMVSYIFTLQPKHIGTLKVPGAQFDYNGQMLSCRSQMVKVLKKEHVTPTRPHRPRAASPLAGMMPNFPGMGIPPDLFGNDPDATAAPVNGIIIHPGQSYGDAAKDDFLIKVTPSKTSCYIGEPILVNYEFMGAHSCSWQPEKFPSFNGFSVTDIDQHYYPYNVQINNRSYRAKTIRKAQLIPLKTGSMPLDSATVSLQTTFVEAVNHADQRTGTVTVKSKPVAINVLPLPMEGKPADYSGAIGQFEISARVDKNKLPAGENNTLFVRIKGAGNLDGVSLPDIDWPASIQAYDPKDSQSVNKSNFPIERSLNFEVPFIGNDSGGAVIPPIVFNYFDGDKKEYVTDSTDEIQIEFTPALHDNGVMVATAGNHPTNQSYLWIIGLIAVVVVASYLLYERSRRPNKNGKEGSKKTQDGTGSEKKSKANAAGGSIPIPMSSTDATRPVPAVDINQQSDHNASSEALRYLPPRLAAEIEQRERSRQQKAADEASADLSEAGGTDRGKTQQQLLEQSLKELEEEKDPKEFFFLAKAFLIQLLQGQLQTTETGEEALLKEKQAQSPEQASEFQALMAKCNKALYMPVTSHVSQQEILEKIKGLLS